MTEQGRSLLREDPDHRGSLGIGMGEAKEYAATHPSSRLALGCMSYYAAMHQTVIGLELEAQLRVLGVSPDKLIGCVGGGTNFIGFVAPFVAGNVRAVKPSPHLIAVESANVPVLTTGRYEFEHADAFGIMPQVKMYTLGKEFLPEKMHAGGLRYHGKSPILSLLKHHEIISATAVSQDDAFQAGRLFFEAEGILPAPESAHAIAQVLIEVEAEKTAGRQSTLVFCLSGNGYLDLQGYADSFQLGSAI
jgi:tryptophan synthase beta chain